jgi:hypothetical protein
VHFGQFRHGTTLPQALGKRFGNELENYNSVVPAGVLCNPRSRTTMVLPLRKKLDTETEDSVIATNAAFGKVGNNLPVTW